MNLYIFNETDSAAIYGIGTYIRELTYALKGSEIKVNVVNLRSSQLKFEIKTIDDVDYWHIPEVKYQNRNIDSIQEMEDYYHNVIYLLKLHISDTKMLIFHLNYNQSYVLAKGLKDTFECKTLTATHYLKWEFKLFGNFARFQAIKSKPENERDPFEQMIQIIDEYESRLFNIVDRIVALSQHTSAILRDEYQLDSMKISFIPNGLKDTFSDSNKKPSIRKKWLLSEKENLILFVGRLNEIKGLNILIQAFHNVLQVMPNCRLIIAGDGEFNSYMQVSGNDCTKITFTGLIDKIRLYDLYSIADIGVMPSFHEQCSYVAIEMMMHGLPIIASTSTGLKEMVEDGITGLHIPVMEHPDKVEIDTTQLAGKMLFLLQNPEERERMGVNARKRYERLYSSEMMRKNMLGLYQSLFK